MKDLPIIWLLLNTNLGKIILLIIIILALVSMFGWWLVPIITVIIAIVLFMDYFSEKRKNNKELIISICLFAFSMAFVLFMNWDNLAHSIFSDKKYPYHQQPRIMIQDVDTAYVGEENDVLDSVDIPNDEKPKSVKSRSKSSTSRSHHNTDNINENMRGWDPASEDDTGDNGMSRYMENNDEEGWD